MDFDHTITIKDSFLHFLRLHLGFLRYYIMIILISPWITLYWMGLLRALKLKGRIFSFAFKSKQLTHVESSVVEYSHSRLPEILHPRALSTLQEHQKKGHQVAIVSASPDLLLKTFAEEHGTELISTQVEVIDGMLTGDFTSPNCKGQEKVRRIKERFDLESFDEIIAYGNLPEDGPMLDLADQKFADTFK